MEIKQIYIFDSNRDNLTWNHIKTGKREIEKKKGDNFFDVMTKCSGFLPFYGEFFFYHLKSTTPAFVIS